MSKLRSLRAVRIPDGKASIDTTSDPELRPRVARLAVDERARVGVTALEKAFTQLGAKRWLDAPA